MRLTDEERAMLDGADGPAKQRAMDLLVRYGEALDAERLVEVTNVAGTWSSTTPWVQADLERPDDFDTIFSRFNLDADDTVETPRTVVSTCQLIHGIDTRNYRLQGFSDEQAALQRKSEEFFGKRGVQWMSTCTPYQVGNVPLKGEHCAWMESSAVVYCNSVLGARTNTEGRESTGAASITGRIPYFGFHIPENRRATHLVHVEAQPGTMMDWGLMGYALGEAVMADYASLRMSLRCHPMALLRGGFGGATPAKELTSVDNDSRITTVGLVLARQRPGTAKGVIFATLEDETGVANIIVWPKTFERFRRIVLTARLLKVTGRLQREGIVTHLIAERLEDCSPLLDSLAERGADDLSGPRPAPPPKSGFRHPRNQGAVLFPSRDFH